MVVGEAVDLRHEGRDILIDILSEDGLDQEDVGIALDGLEDTEIIHISVSVEVQVVEDVGGVVDKVFELLYGL